MEDVKEAFVRYLTQSPPPESIIAMSPAELRAQCEDALKLLDTLPKDLRMGLGTSAVPRGRFPELSEVVHLLGKGLASHPELIEQTQISPELIKPLLDLDYAVSCFHRAARMLAVGGANGSILAGHTLMKLCERALSQAQIVETTTRDLGLQFTIGIVFHEARQLWAKLAGQGPSVKDKLKGARETLAQATVPAQDGPLMKKLVDAFFFALAGQGAEAAR